MGSSSVCGAVAGESRGYQLPLLKHEFCISQNLDLYFPFCILYSDSVYVLGFMCSAFHS